MPLASLRSENRLFFTMDREDYKKTFEWTLCMSKVYTHAMIDNKITNLEYQSKCYERKRKKMYTPLGLVDEVTWNMLKPCQIILNQK